MNHKSSNKLKKDPASKATRAKGSIKSIADVDAQTARFLEPAFTKELTAHIQRATKKAVSQSQSKTTKSPKSTKKRGGPAKSINDVHPDLRRYLEPAFTQELLEHMHKAKIKALTPRRKA